MKGFFLLAVLVGHVALADTKLSLCTARVNRNALPPAKLARAFRDVPGLRTHLLRLAYDPEMPLAVRRLLVEGVRRETHIVNLTDDIRATWNIRPTVRALADFRRLPFDLTTDTPLHLDLNASTALALRAQFHSRRFGVTVADRPIDAKNNDLILLIHELAHVRFEAFLERNLRRLIGRLPTDLVGKHANGRVWMNRELYGLLHERYAWEMEFLVFRNALGRYFTHWFVDFKESMRTMSPDQVREEIAALVVRTYQIRDPRVIALSKKPLREILLGHRNRAQLDELAALTLVEFEGPEKLAWSLKFALLASPVARNHDIVPPNRNTALDRLLERPDGATHALLVFASVLASADEDPALRDNLLTFLSGDATRKKILERMGWEIPTNLDADDVKPLIQSHPLMQGLFRRQQPTGLEGDLVLLISAAEGIEQVPPPPYGKYSTAFEAAELAGWRKQKLQTAPLYLLPAAARAREVAKIPLENQPLWARGPEGLEAFWDQLDVGAVYRDGFRRDGSLLEVYRRYRNAMARGWVPK